MSPAGKITPHIVANEILETTMLASLLGGSSKDNLLGKKTKHDMGFKSSGSVDAGDLSLSYTFSDGTKGNYALIHGTYSARTGFQAAAFEKTLTTPDGQKHSSIKLVFPGTARKSQFSDPNSVDTFWLKRIGSQIHNVKEWMETEVKPRLPEGKKIEISGHCLGTQEALWTKAYLEKECHMRVATTSLIEPTAPGLVIDNLTNDIKAIYNIHSREAIKDLYRDVYSVFVDPPTIVCPFGQGNTWDAAPVGDQTFTVHLPATKMYEELGKALHNPRAFYHELEEKKAVVLHDLKIKESKGGHDHVNGHVTGNGTHEKTAPHLPHEASSPTKGVAISPSDLRSEAFFKTAFGKELKQQFFKNHYLLTIVHQLQTARKPIEELVSEGHPPDAPAMLAHHTPHLDKHTTRQFKQMVIASIVDTGRDIAHAVTEFCLQGGRKGVPSIVEQSYLWNDPGILTMDDTLAGNYPPPFFRKPATSQLRQVLEAIRKVMACPSEESPSRQRLEKAARPIMLKLGLTTAPLLLAALPEGILTEDVTEIQARAIVRLFPELREALLYVEQQAGGQCANCRATIAAMAEAEETLRRAYTIKPEQDKVHYL